MAHFPRVILAAAAALGLLAAGGVPAASPATAPSLAVADGGARAGVAVVDASWHVGAASGQYASAGTASGAHGIDPYLHATRRLASYGLESPITVRALVVEGTAGERVAVVANDLYLSQDLLTRRVASLVEDHDRRALLGLTERPATGISAERLALTASHSHGSPYLATPSWGVWVFQDVFDLRFFDYMARQMAEAVIAAAADLRPVRMGGASGHFNEINSHSYGPQIADDGTPAGQPRDFTTQLVSVVRFDDVSEPADPQPLATWVVFGMHPEFSNRDDLVSGEFNHAVYRLLDREIGGVTLLSQKEIGAAGPHKDVRVHPPEARREFQDLGFSQMERAARILADRVRGISDGIEAGTPEDPAAYAAFETDFTVGAVSIRFAPPATRPYPGVSNCRTERAFEGDPGVPIAGFPDCVFPAGGTIGPVFDQSPVHPHDLWWDLKEAGVPLPESYSPPAYSGLEETIAVHLQAMRLGGIGITFCPCEQMTDQALNIISRINTVPGDLFLGWDWAEQTTPAGRDWCVENPGGTWTCANPRNPAQDLAPVSDLTYRRMRAQIHNDARGWDDLANAPWAEAEAHDPGAIKGNFTHEELTEFGFDLVLPVGTTNDYWGYVPSYREYVAFDHYRKALSGLGPHGQDWLATRLTRMAASLNGGPPVDLSPLDLAYQAEHIQAQARADALGEASAAARAAYEAALPPDGGSPAIMGQPGDIRRFEAATVSFIGGSNYFDLPQASVERLEGGGWVPFADTRNEVQVFPAFPQDEDDLALWRSGEFAWVWTANFEAFNSDLTQPDAAGVPRRQTPEGTYRFVIEGTRGEGIPPQPAPYRLESDPFTVAAWDGITVEDLRVEPDGSVSFAVGPIATYTFGGIDYRFGPVGYPGTYPSDIRYIAASGPQRFTYGLADPARHSIYCPRCSFRPWAMSAEVAEVWVTVERDGGGVEQIQAVRAGDRWVAPASLGPGDTAYVAAGGIVDEFGERNASPSAPAAG